MTNSEYIGNELHIFMKAVNWKKYWSSKVSPYIKGDVLEVGAGIGANTQYIARDFKDISRLVCIEPDANLSANIINDLPKSQIEKIEIKNCYLKDMDSSVKFDTILYIDVIEHIEFDADEVELAKSYLKEGGHLIILVPAYNYLFSEFDKAIGHYRRYNKRMLLTSGGKGLTKVKLFYLDSVGVILSFTNKILLKQGSPTMRQILFWDRLIVPISKIVDYIVFHAFGKSLVGIWRK